MINGRFYSRRQGWCGGSSVKHYNSGIFDKLPNLDLNDKNGKYISNYLKINNLETDYKELYMYSRIYLDWYFYHSDNVEIFSSESL